MGKCRQEGNRLRRHGRRAMWEGKAGNETRMGEERNGMERSEEKARRKMKIGEGNGRWKSYCNEQHFTLLPVKCVIVVRVFSSGQ